jgi:hypothetical protein
MIAKLLSGRWLLTIACAIVFVYASINKILEAQAVSAIIASVFQAYFSRNDRQQPTEETKKP